MTVARFYYKLAKKDKKNSNANAFSFILSFGGI